MGVRYFSWQTRHPTAQLAIEPVTSHRDREHFLRLPWDIYAGNPCWVPPLLLERRRLLDPHTNPFFRHADVQLFLARRGTRYVGRIAAFVNHAYNRFHADRVGFFGFFESIDSEAAAALLEIAERWARERGMRVLRGPVNFATDNEVGLLLDAFDEPPVLMTVYNPPHYRGWIEAAGFAGVVDWYAYIIDRETLGGGATDDLPPALLRAVEHARHHSGASFRTVQMGEFDAELARARDVYNRAWEHNQDFVPLDEAEIAFLAQSLRQVVDPDLVFFAEVNGKPVGVSITLPDFNQILRTMNGRLLPLGWWRLLRGRSRIDTARVFAMGVVPEYRHRAIDTVFYYETFRAAIRKGYRRAELSLIVASNRQMRGILEGLGARIYKTYRVYGKTLAPTWGLPEDHPA